MSWHHVELSLQSYLEWTPIDTLACVKIAVY